MWAERIRPPRFSDSIATAMLLKKQNPQQDPAEAWCPGGRMAAKQGSAIPISAARTAPPAASAAIS